MKFSFINLIILFTLGSSVCKAQKAIYLDEKQSIEKRVENALSLMTFDEKVALCHAQSKFSSKGVARLGIPELYMTDGPHGVREEMSWGVWLYAGWTNDSCTAFPALTCLAATFNPELSFKYGKAIGEEARYRKKDILLGPGVNIYRTPMNGRNFEYMGEDPLLSAKMVVPYITGVQENGVAACVKHFALNSQEDSRLEVDVQVSERALNEIYLPAFKAAVMEGKAWAIMGAYNQLRGQHCCHNDLLLNKTLKQKWGFDGAVISDWNGTHNTLEAGNNGLDIEMGTDPVTTGNQNVFDYFFLANPYKDAIRNGNVSIKTLDDKARRILRLIFRTSMNRNSPWGSFGTPEHAEVARNIAEEGIVLLKNNGDILPLNQKSIKNIAVIGENATKRLTVGGGSSGLKAKYEVSPLQGLKNQLIKDVNISYSLGYSSANFINDKLVPTTYNADSLTKAAVKAAKSADVVLYFGGLNKNPKQDSEGDDRVDFNLPFGQDDLLREILKVNKNVVVVLISGNAVAMPWVKEVPAILQSWYLGSESGNAIASVLSGKVNPSGKLPFSFPVKLNDNAAHSFGAISYPGVNKKEEYKEDILVGYRWFDTKNISPLFAFGYGLSYTTFDYGKVSTDKIKYGLNDVVKLTFALKNSGKVQGAEVAQVYVTELNPSVLRPFKELKAFTKVLLESDETKQIELNLSVKDWSFFNDKTQNWEVKPGKYVIRIGSASSDIRQNVTISVE